jgi:cobaltochelatase CobS
MDNQSNIARLEDLAKNSPVPLVREQAQKELDKLASIGSVQVQSVNAGVTGLDPDVQAVLDALNMAVQGGGVANINDIRQVVIDELAKRKINFNDLSDSLKALLNSTRKVELTIRNIASVQTTTTTSNDFLTRPIIQKILSDMQAENNVYLYGGAGTGKTFSAGGIAKLLGWSIITINCNQFTSPIDIIGGQTIDGYQEGKFTMAWSNEIIDDNGNMKKVDGCVLLLDELPKIDPNTAGLLNEGLAKIKEYDYDPNTGTRIPPSILNGRGERKYLGNCFIMAAGNVPLNTIDPDYEANFKQDLSLQDRFIGSTYKVFVDYSYEFSSIMKGYAFIWIFGTKLREAIIRLNATNQAFVSIRLMQNLKATYDVYRIEKEKNDKGMATTITSPKTIIDSLNTFFELFKPSTRSALLAELDIDGFKRVVAEKDKMPFDKKAPDFNTPSEVQEAQQMISNYEATQLSRVI